MRADFYLIDKDRFRAQPLLLVCELARKAYEKVVGDMKDLAEIARKAQADAMASITQRSAQHLEEVKRMMK